MSQFRDKFNAKLDETYNSKKKANTFLFSAEKYDAMIAKLEAIARIGPKERKDYFLWDIYEIHVLNDVKRIFKKKDNREIVRMHEMYDILQTVHSSTGHAGRDKMRKSLENMPILLKKL